MESGAEVVLCGHDHQERADVLDARVVASCAGTLSTRSRGGRPSVFHRVIVEEQAVQVELYRWESDQRAFRRSHVHAFARPHRGTMPNAQAAADVA